MRSAARADWPLYDQVAALHAAGTPKKRIAREVGLSRHTVVAWLAAGHFPERAARQRPAPKRMDAYAGELAAYYDGGGTNAAELARALRAVGYRGTNTTVRRALALLRGTRPRAALGADASPPPTRAAVPVPSPRQVAWLLRKSDAAAHRRRARLPHGAGGGVPRARRGADAR